MKYPFDSHTRVSILATVASVTAPTVANLNAGTDITCDLTPDGLRISPKTVTVDSTPWAYGSVVTRPVRYDFSGAGLRGFRYEQPDTELLWDAALFRARKFVVVRRGMAFDAAWAASQEVEVYEVLFGKRSVEPSNDNSLTTFEVDLHVRSNSDAAVVAA